MFLVIEVFFDKLKTRVALSFTFKLALSISEIELAISFATVQTSRFVPPWAIATVRVELTSTTRHGYYII